MADEEGVLLGYCPREFPVRRWSMNDEERLFKAVANRRLSKVQRLLRNGALNVNALRKAFRCLHISIQSVGTYTVLGLAVQVQDVDIVRAILGHPQTDVNLRAPGFPHFAPLFVAVGNAVDARNVGEDKWTILSDILGNEKVDVHIRDGIRNTPLHRAVEDPRAVRMLLEKNAEPNLQNRYGDTPLHKGVQDSDPEVVRLLLDGNANPNTRNRYGHTPLLVACQTENYDDLYGSGDQVLSRVEMLLASEANAAVTDYNDKTPLYEAARRALPNVVEALLLSIRDARDVLDYLETIAAHETETAFDVVGEAVTDQYDATRTRQAQTSNCILKAYKKAMVRHYGNMCIHAFLHDQSRRRYRQRRRMVCRNSVALSVGSVDAEELHMLLDYFHRKKPGAAIVGDSRRGRDRMLPPVLVAAHIGWPLGVVFELLRKNPTVLWCAVE